MCLFETHFKKFPIFVDSNAIANNGGTSTVNFQLDLADSECRRFGQK